MQWKATARGKDRLFESSDILTEHQTVIILNTNEVLQSTQFSNIFYSVLHISVQRSIIGHLFTEIKKKISTFAMCVVG
jgi:hypothetical protein